MGDWVGLRAGPDVLRKDVNILLLPGIEPRIAEPVANHYCTPAVRICCIVSINIGISKF
jgi:hypothetical protein